MANDRDITIGILTQADTSGATQAAAALDSVAEAAASVARETGATGRQGGAQNSVFGGAAAGAAALASAAGNTAPALDAAGNQSRRTGAAMQNMGFQVADVAVQLEQGASAARVFAQQGSQMLGALGPWGAVIGAAVAILGALAPQIGKLLGVMDEKKPLDAFNEALAELSVRLGELAAEKAAANTQEWLDSLESENEKILRGNNLRKDQLDLESELRRLKMERLEAEADRAKSDVDQIEGVTEAEKISKKAAIDEILKKIKLEEKHAQLKADLSEKERAAEEKNTALADTVNDAGKKKQARSSLELEQIDIKRSLRAEQGKIDHRPQLREEQEKAFDESERRQRTIRRLQKSGITADPIALAQAKKAEEKANSLWKQLQDADEAEMRIAKQKIKKDEVASKLQTLPTYKEINDEVEQAKIEADTARRELAMEGKLFPVRQQTLNETFEDEAIVRKRNTDKQAAAAAAQAAAEAKQRTEQGQRDEESRRLNEQKNLPKREDLADEEAATIAAGKEVVIGTRGSEFFPPVETVLQGFNDGGTGAEYAAMAREMEVFVNALTTLTQGRRDELLTVAKQFRDLSERVKKIESQ